MILIKSKPSQLFMLDSEIWETKTEKSVNCCELSVKWDNTSQGYLGFNKISKCECIVMHLAHHWCTINANYLVGVRILPFTRVTVNLKMNFFSIPNNIKMQMWYNTVKKVFNGNW